MTLLAKQAAGEEQTLAQLIDNDDKVDQTSCNSVMMQSQGEMNAAHPSQGDAIIGTPPPQQSATL